MYNISVSGYKVVKSTWGASAATGTPETFEVLASFEKGKRLTHIGIASDFDGVRRIIGKLIDNSAQYTDYISIQVIVKEPNGGHWHIYYRLYSLSTVAKTRTVWR